jgi:hypothetical protein
MFTQTLEHQRQNQQGTAEIIKFGVGAGGITKVTFSWSQTLTGPE